MDLSFLEIIFAIMGSRAEGRQVVFPLTGLRDSVSFPPKVVKEIPLLSKWHCWFLVFLFAASVIAAPSIVSAQEPVLVSIDEPAPESDPDHNSDPGADLTYQFAWLEGASSDTPCVPADTSGRKKDDGGVSAAVSCAEFQ